MLLLLRRLGILAVTIVLAPAFTYVVFTTLRADSFTPGETLSGLWDWMRAFLLHGDLGYDEDFDLPLTQVLLDGLPVDLVMMAGGLAFGLGVGAIGGLVAVARPRASRC